MSVAATSRGVAEDAIELIDVDYDPLPHVSDAISAQLPEAPVLHPDVVPTNLLASNPQGMGDSDAAFAAAETIVEGRFTINRVTGLPMEARGTVAEWRARRARADGAHLDADAAPGAQPAGALPAPRRGRSARDRVATWAARSVSSSGVYPEDLLACLHTMALGRPVKWIEDRLEHFRATTHAREAVHDFRIGASGDGRIVAMENVYTTDLGAYNSPVRLGSALQRHVHRALSRRGRLRRAARGDDEQDADRARTAATASPR